MKRMTLLVKAQMVLVFIPLIVAEIIDVDYTCPSSHKIEPCKCSYSPDEEKLILECSGAAQDKLSRAVGAFRQQEICILSLINSRLVVLERDQFLNNLTAEIINLNNVIVNHFSLFKAFNGMQNTLYGIGLHNVSVLNWNYELAENFTHLRTFYLGYCPGIPELKKIFSSFEDSLHLIHHNVSSVISTLPEELCSIIIHRCKAALLSDETFKRFTNLQKLDLSYNLLNIVKRNHLPWPANKFSSFNLSFNPITSLPDNMFVDMPALERISLQGTHMTTLSYDVFKPVLLQLDSLILRGIPLICDCSATWLLMHLDVWDASWNKPAGVECDRPHLLKNREAGLLMPMDMCMKCEGVVQNYSKYKERKINTESSSYTEGYTVSEFTETAMLFSTDSNY